MELQAFVVQDQDAKRYQNVQSNLWCCASLSSLSLCLAIPSFLCMISMGRMEGSKEQRFSDFQLRVQEGLASLLCFDRFPLLECNALHLKRLCIWFFDSSIQSIAINSINQVNGTYMQDPKVAYLQDCCNTLEHHLVKVTSECDTIKHLFDQLTNAVKSMMCSPLLNTSSLPLQALMIMDKKALTHKSCPNVCFWMKKDFDDWLDSAEAKGSDRGIYAYLEDANGNVPSQEMLSNMWKTLCGAWMELSQHRIISKSLFTGQYWTVPPRATESLGRSILDSAGQRGPNWPGLPPDFPRLPQNPSLP
ncbi:hypothetical protein BKA83DRAFT_4131315 [Pisolithus microcarpus]|nr:hypothetical protein BKA83DRAFT_4131315 [Pisolithus microcarpus]